MSFLELAKKRYSARSYQNKPLEPEKLAEILQAGRVAPTACNNQPQRILVVQSPEGLAKLPKRYQTFGAPVALIVCADHEESWRRSYDGKDSADIDTAIVTDHMMLCAADLGVDSVWICAFNAATVQEDYEIPSHLEPVNILLLGYTDANPESPERHNKCRVALEDTVFYESF